MDVGLMERIEATSGRLEKEALIAQMDNNTLRRVKMALDPDLTFGVTVDEGGISLLWSMEGMSHRDDPEAWWSTLEVDLLEPMSTRMLTGNAAKAATEQHLVHAPTQQDLKWAARLVNRQLRAGFDFRTVNKVFGAETIHKFAVQLAATHRLGKGLRGHYVFQPKLNGNRVVIWRRKMWSRNGKPYHAADHIIAELEAAYPTITDSYVLDGEMVGNLGFDQSSGALRRLSERAGRPRAEFTYWVFDIVPVDIWEARGAIDHLARQEHLDRILEEMAEGPGVPPHVRVVPSSEIFKDPTDEQIIEACRRYVLDGFEGVMIKRIDAPYEWKRGKAILKFKLFHEGDFRVVDFYAGDPGSKIEHTLGGLVVEGTAYDGSHVRTRVGSGYDDATRDIIWNDRPGWMNAVVQVQYQEVGSRGALQFPVFMMRRKDKE